MLPKKVFVCDVYLDNGETVQVRYLSEYITDDKQSNTLLSCIYKDIEIVSVFRYRNLEITSEDMPTAIWKAIENNSKNMWELEMNSRKLITT